MIFRYKSLSAEALSLFTALCFGFQSVFIKKGLKNSNSMTGVLIAIIVQSVIVSTLLVFYPPISFNGMAIFFFIVAGILSSTFGSLFNFIAIKRLGISISSPITGSSSFFSTLFAIIILREYIQYSTYISLFLLIIGVFLINSVNRSQSKIKKTDIIFPLLTAMFYGSSTIVWKLGVNILPNAILGSAIGSVSGLFSFIMYLGLTSGLKKIVIDRKGLIYFGSSGVMVVLGWLSMFNALKITKVSTVSILISVNPLFSLILSILFLKESENVTIQSVIGCLTIILSTIIIILFS